MTEGQLTKLSSTQWVSEVSAGNKGAGNLTIDMVATLGLLE